MLGERKEIACSSNPLLMFVLRSHYVTQCKYNDLQIDHPSNMHSTTRQASATKRSRRAHSRPNSLQHHDRIDKRASTTKLSTNRQSSAPTGSKRWNCRKLNKRISNLIILLLSVQVMVCFVDIGSHFEIKTKATLLKANNYTALFQKDTSSRSIVTANRTNPAYAYAFLIAGCDPAMTRSHHRGFLYNVLVSAKSKLLRLVAARCLILYLCFVVLTIYTARPHKLNGHHYSTTNTIFISSEGSWLSSRHCIIGPNERPLIRR